MQISLETFNQHAFANNQGQTQQMELGLEALPLNKEDLLDEDFDEIDWHFLLLKAQLKALNDSRISDKRRVEILRWVLAPMDQEEEQDKEVFTFKRCVQLEGADPAEFQEMIVRKYCPALLPLIGLD